MWLEDSGTLIGPYHVFKGEPNQDYFRYENFESRGIVLIAVADGAGSLDLSGEGAKLSTGIAMEHMVNHAEEAMDFQVLLREAIGRARERLLNEPEFKRMGCTLTLAAASRDNWAVATVGDSFAVISTEERGLELIQAPSSSEYANVTKLLTSKDPEIHVVGGLEPLDFLAVSTDGLETTALEDGKPFPGFWNVLMEKSRNEELDLEELFTFMEGKDLISDDTTLVSASWRSDADSTS